MELSTASSVPGMELSTASSVPGMELSNDLFSKKLLKMLVLLWVIPIITPCSKEHGTGTDSRTT
jgi:hypothetical protein